MFYDDEARRFNFLSGLLLGAVLGTGLALLAAPQGRRKVSKKSKEYREALKHAVDRAKEGKRPTKGARGGLNSLRAAARRAAR